MLSPSPSCVSSLVPVAALLALPEGAERAVLAYGEVLALLVRATHVALAHDDRPDAVLLEELLKFLLYLGVRGHVGPDPPLQDGLGPIVGYDRSGDLGRRLVVGAVEGDGADG